jgi:hypothetical protein
LVVHEALEDAVLGPQQVVVDAAHRHRSRPWPAHWDLLRPRRQVAGELDARAKDPGRLDHQVGAELAPGNRLRRSLLGHGNAAAVDVEIVGVASHLALEDAHHGVVLQEVGELLVGEEIVDPHHLDIRARSQDAVHRAPDATETVDADARPHYAPSFAASRRHPRGSSTARWEYPQLLSNQQRVFDSLSPITIVAWRRRCRPGWQHVARHDGIGLVIDDSGERTSGGPRTAALIDSTVTGRACQQTRSTAEPLATGMLTAAAVSLPASPGSSLTISSAASRTAE